MQRDIKHQHRFDQSSIPATFWKEICADKFEESLQGAFNSRLMVAWISASFLIRNSFNNKSELLWSEFWYRLCKGKRKAAQEVNFILVQKLFATLCTHHLIFFGGVSASIPKLEHGGEVASVAAAASRKKKRLVGLWKVASECCGSLLRSTIRLLVDGGCDAEAAVKHTGTTSGKLSKKKKLRFLQMLMLSVSQLF